MDSTQDVGVMDQTSICVRYMNDGHIKERLFAIVQEKSSKGEELYQLLKYCFFEHGFKYNW